MNGLEFESECCKRAFREIVFSWRWISMNGRANVNPIKEWIKSQPEIYLFKAPPAG